MLAANRPHFKRVLVWGLTASAALSALSLFKFSPIVAGSVMVGALLGMFNLYSVVRLVEALTGAALAGAVTGKGSKALTMVFHLINIALVAAVLVVLVLNHLVNLFAFLAGFTVILITNMFAGLSGLAHDSGKAP